MINKPFRFLKDTMRFYSKEADNILKQVSELNITSELWNKAVENFNRRGLHIPMYQNHDENIVVGRVNKIEAREDGLYVVEHELNEKGQELVEKGIYDLPSGDFVLHYDKEGNLVDLEVFGVSIVNSEGAKDVEMITMSKENKKIALDKIIKQNKKTEDKMDKEQVLEILLDEEFLKKLPDDVLKKIIEVKKEVIEKILKPEGTNTGGENDPANPADPVEPAKEGEGEKVTEEKEKIEETEQKKACMSKFQDVLAQKIYEEKIAVIPSTLKKAEQFISRNFKDFDKDKVVELALDLCGFYGNGITEKVTMKKTNTDKMSNNDILFELAKGGK